MKNRYLKTNFTAALLLILSSFFVLNSCVEEDEPVLILSTENIEIDDKSQKETIEVKANGEWSAQSDAEWCRIIRGTGRLHGYFDIMMDDNLTVENRTAVVTVSGNGVSAALSVRQKAADVSIKLSTDSLQFDKAAEKYYLTILANHEWTAKSSAEWCVLSAEKGSKSGGVEISVKENTSGKKRSAHLTLSSEANGQSILKTVQITQMAGSFEILTEEVTISKAGETVFVPIVSASPFTAQSSHDWCKVSVEEGQVKIETGLNDTGTERTAVVTVSLSGTGNEVISKTFKVKQTMSSFEIMVQEVTVSQMGETVYVPVTCSYTFTATSSNSWCKVSVEKGQVKVVVGKNDTGSVRTAIVTVTAVSEEGESTSKTFAVIQKLTSFEILTKEVAVNNLGETVFVPVLSSSPFTARSSSDWCQVSVEKSDVKVVAAMNNTDADRVAIVTVTLTQAIENEVASKTFKVIQLVGTFEISVSEILLSHKGETILVPVNSSSPFVARSSSDWCQVSVEGKEVKVVADMNTSGAERTAIVTVTLGKEGESSISKSFKVVQAYEEILFQFPQKSYQFKYEGETRQIILSATGDWEIATENLPRWLSVTPSSGKGSQPVTFTAEKNLFIKERRLDILFQNTLTKQNFILTITQDKNPSSAIDDYKYLGMGYDATGEYATDQFVKDAVLDWDKLNNEGYIAPIILASSTYEHKIEGSTLQQYQRDFSHAAGISGNYAGFSASVTGSYSSKTYSSSENKFSSFRHITQKQTVKLGEHLGIDELRNCMSETAKKEINGELNPDQVVLKYGTHVVAGFILGGSLDYTMTADASTMSNEVDWSIAVKAGYESASAGVNASYEYKQYESMKKESTNFEEKLVARGGDSQLASSLGTQSTRSQWLGSLSDPQKWVMVDYAGQKLLSIADFAEEEGRRNELRGAIDKYMEKKQIGQSSSYKEFALHISSVMFMDTDGDTNENDKATINAEIYTTINTFARSRIWETEGLEIEPEGKGTTIINEETSTKKLSIHGVNRVTLQIEGKERDTVTGNNPDLFTRTIVLTLDRGGDKWTDEGTGDSYGNGDSIWVNTYDPKETDLDKAKVLARFELKLHWQ
ncbi:hypothetical protein M2137_002737 [Parabacteroides sp. PFB2-10]|uniref:BACON domain-containing protein n=1 Tax=Parabacteroides sp. PFB2-10 TaxID=1742405 RepID=UPI0024762782|nr:BACON domain-containing carbohydrate-binding protein [Parabacteroides sp. PFB2-10]MDH6313945.1 hypothetical protein [Parabacteroides sp. PFB2-10]